MTTRPRLSVDVPREGAPGPWLRLASLGGAFATALAVSSGALQLGLAHRLLVVTAVPPLAVLALAGRLAYPRLLRPAALALGLVLLDSAVGGVVALAGSSGWSVGLHLAVAAAAFALA